jgi:nucleotide-binding universal stress UspA family protein
MFRKILVPLDGSDLAAKILPQVEDLANAFNAEITLLTVGSLATVLIAAEFAYKDPSEFTAKMKEGAEKDLEVEANRLRARGLKVNIAYTEGLPAREIIAYAKEKGCDLIAMATHGRGEIAWVLGSVAEKVVSHATVPVLMMRVLTAEPIEDKLESVVS